MIERIFIKDSLVFDEVELYPNKGLNVFSGASGSGKSVLFSSILSIFSLKDAQASLAQASLTQDDDDVLVVSCVKKEKARYFIDDLQSSKKALQQKLGNFLRFLNHKDKSDTDPQALLELVDSQIKSKTFKATLTDLQSSYAQMTQINQDLLDLKNKREHLQKTQQDLKMQIDTIERIKPKKGELDNLLDLKKDISKQEKLQDALNDAMRIFEHENSVFKLLSLIDEPSDTFEAQLEALKETFEKLEQRLQGLHELDPEKMLLRIEALSSLVRTHGSEEEAVIFAQKARTDLQNIENLDDEIIALEKKHLALTSKVNELARSVTKTRLKSLLDLQSKMNSLASQLRLPKFSLSLEQTQLSKNGNDLLVLNLEGANVQSMSSGEFNRLRLIVLALKSQNIAHQILFFDEIDANVSGAEALAIGALMQDLSKKHQIFAISHQPQLSSRANNHYLIEKNGTKASVKLLDEEEKIAELARMMSGKIITKDALKQAQNLLQEAQC